MSALYAISFVSFARRGRAVSAIDLDGGMRERKVRRVAGCSGEVVLPVLRGVRMSSIIFVSGDEAVSTKSD
jgi:hypothetical protein